MKIPIKQTLYVVTTALVMGSSVQSVSASPIPSQTITANDKMGSEWTLVQEMNGVSISFASVVIGEERFLSVKFENSNSEEIDFIWTMTKNNESIMITEDEMIQSVVRLDAKSFMIHDGTYLIELSEGDQFSDFVVSIQPTKR